MFLLLLFVLSNQYFVLQFKFNFVLCQIRTEGDRRTAETVTGKSTDFTVCVIRNIFIRKLSHLTISSPFILVIKKCIKTTVAFE